jgi:hypothetical protein
MRRRAFQAVNLADQVVDYQPGQIADVHTLLQDIIDNPKNFLGAFRECVSGDNKSNRQVFAYLHDDSFMVGNTLRTTYGIKVKSRDDPIVLAGEDLNHAIPDALEPGRWLPE